MLQKKAVGELKTHIAYHVFTNFFSEYSAVYENMWKNTLERAGHR
jgi:hypothetical protein